MVDDECCQLSEQGNWTSGVVQC